MRRLPAPRSRPPPRPPPLPETRLRQNRERNCSTRSPCGHATAGVGAGGGGWAEEGGSDSTSAAEECATKLEPFTSGAEGPFRPLSEPDVRRAGSPAPSRRPRPLAQAPPRGGRWARGAGGAGGGRPPSLPQGPGSRASRGARVLGPRLPAAGAHRLTGVLRFRFFASAETEQSAPRRWGRPPSGPALVGLRGCRRGSA